MPTVCPQCIYVLCALKNKQLVFPHTTFTDWSWNGYKLLYVRQEPSLYIKCRLNASNSRQNVIWFQQRTEVNPILNMRNASNLLADAIL